MLDFLKTTKTQVSQYFLSMLEHANKSVLANKTEVLKLTYEAMKICWQDGYNFDELELKIKNSIVEYIYKSMDSGVGYSRSLDNARSIIRHFLYKGRSINEVLGFLERPEMLQGIYSVGLKLVLP